jgi:nickel-dependent lactate racemase
VIADLRYGAGTLSVELPSGMAVEQWAAPAATASPSEEEVVAGALDRPVGTAPLLRLAAGARRVAILVSGKDRVAGARVYLPVLLERLRRAGVTDSAVEIVCATGTHARHTAEDVRALVGNEVAARVRFRAHDCDARDGFVDLGYTSRGTPVLLDRAVVEADLRILTGRITHHYFAGFSGGRKSLLPGVAARPTIVANHRLVLDFSAGCHVHPAVFGGNLAGNPVHEDMVEAAHRAGPSFVLNTVLDAAERIRHAVAGEIEAAHEEGCRAAASLATFHPEPPADLVVASTGGYPGDINFIQSVKTVFNHQDAVEPGGVFVLVAEAAGGILAGMREWMRIPDRELLGVAIEARYDLAAHNTLMLRDLLATRRVIVVSRLPAAHVLELGLTPAESIPEALEAAYRLLGGRPARVRLIHHGNTTQSRLRTGTIGPGAGHGRTARPGPAVA